MCLPCARWKAFQGICGELNTPCLRVMRESEALKPYQGRGVLSLAARSHSNESALVSQLLFQITTRNTRTEATTAVTVLEEQTQLPLTLSAFKPPQLIGNKHVPKLSQARSRWSRFDRTFNALRCESSAPRADLIHLITTPHPPPPSYPSYI